MKSLRNFYMKKIASGAQVNIFYCKAKNFLRLNVKNTVIPQMAKKNKVQWNNGQF